MLDDRACRSFCARAHSGWRSRERRAPCPRSAPDADAARFQIGQRDGIALAFLAQPQIAFQRQILEAQRAGVGRGLAQLMFHLVHVIAGPVGGNKECADAALALLRISDRKGKRETGDLARSDELLAAIQHIAIALPRGAAADGAGVRARMSFGQGERADGLARHQPRQKAFTLGRAAAAYQPEATRLFCTLTMVESGPSAAANSISDTA